MQNALFHKIFQTCEIIEGDSLIPEGQSPLAPHTWGQNSIDPAFVALLHMSALGKLEIDSYSQAEPVIDTHYQPSHRPGEYYPYTALSFPQSHHCSPNSLVYRFPYTISSFSPSRSRVLVPRGQELRVGYQPPALFSFLGLSCLLIWNRGSSSRWCLLSWGRL